MADTKLPAIQWYPGDWRKDPGVQASDYETRGVWFECCMLMHESEDRGKLVLNGRPMPDPAIARLLGISQEKWGEVRATLLAYGIASEAEDGTIYNRRMVSDEELRRKRAEAGRRGGRSGGRPAENTSSAQAKPQQTPSKPPSKPSSKSKARKTSKRAASSTIDEKQTASKTEANAKQTKPPSVSVSVSASTKGVLNLPASAGETLGGEGEPNREQMPAHRSRDPLWSGPDGLMRIVHDRWHLGSDRVQLGQKSVGIGLECVLLNELLHATDDPEFVDWGVRHARSVFGWGLDEPATLYWLVGLGHDRSGADPAANLSRLRAAYDEHLAQSTEPSPEARSIASRTRPPEPEPNERQRELRAQLKAIQANG